MNEYLYRSGKNNADNKAADWFHTVGKGVIFVEPSNEKGVPYHAYALDPRSAFVVYSLKPGNKPVMGVNFVVNDGKARFDVFTEKNVFHLSGVTTGKMITYENNCNFLATAVNLDSVEPNPLGKIQIIEYRYNNVNMSSFESAIPLIDEISNIYSNACDGVEQFIQSLAIAVNCEFPENTTITDIRKAGMIALRSVGENKADFKVLSEQLDQSQTKTLIDSLYDEILRICAMPSRSNGGSTYDTTGAAVLANFGWYQADAAARNTEDLFKESNRQFDAIVVEILKRKQLVDIDLSDFELSFVRNEVANIQSKAQACNTLLASGFSPELAFAKSGISNDPVEDVILSKKWLEMRWGNPDKTPDDKTPQTEEKMESVEVDGEV
jgi:SPP1 family phage portal protein